MASIRLATASNVRSFQILVNTLLASSGKWTEHIDQEALEDEFGRLRVWSGNLGALQKGHSSMDYRLRDSPLLFGNALKFLEELNQNLDEAYAIISGARLPYEDQPKSESDKQVDEDNDDGFFSEDDEEEEAEGSRKELKMRYEEVVDIIDNLYKLSVRIRTPTIRSRSLKAASYQPKDSETGVDILSMYALYDKQHTEELLRHLRQPHIGGVQIDDGFLASRLAQGVTLRRRQFKYWKRHREKLSVSTLSEENAVQIGRPIEQAKQHLLNDAVEVLSPQNVISKSYAPSQRTGKTMLSGTEATHHHQSLDDIVDTKSVTSYAVTVTDIDGKGVSLPPPPKHADGERDFECPYCYIICPARYGRGRSWRTHLLQDLQPYVCTYPDCEASEQLFRSRREWNEHEASHRKAWRCPEHPSAVYRSRIGLEGHLRQKHLDSFPESQLETMIKIGETSTVEVRERCPVCFLSANADSMGDFANHLANHLERFAVFALPNSSEDDSDGASSAASRGRSGSTTSQNVSGMSLPSDVSDEEEQSGRSVMESRGSDEEPLDFEQGPEGVPEDRSPLSAESLLSLPDASRNRLDAFLAQQLDEQDDEDGEESNETPADVQKHLELIENFRAYLLSLPGALTVRRYGAWRGHAIFSNGPQAAQALELFDKSLWPQVKIQQGTESNRNKLKFSVPNTDVIRATPTRASTSNMQDNDKSSISSFSIVYDDEETVQSKAGFLSVSDIPTLRELYRTRKLLQRDQSFAPSDSHNRVVSFCFYDITRLKVDAIVNSANNSMKVSRDAATLNYSIHKAGGPKLSEEAASKGGLKPGQAVLTGGHNLPCDYVIHASRPQYSANKGMGQFNILTVCYRSALRIALIQGIKSVAFPCLGAGGCGFPPRVAARIALQEVREFLDSQTQHPFEQIIFVVNSTSDEKAYMDLFPVFFPPTHGDLEIARSSESSADRAALAAQALETRLQVQKVAGDLSAELSLFVPDFPKAILEELHGIDSVLASVRRFLLGPNMLKRSLRDLGLLCSVMQTICGSITELTESAKGMPFSGARNHEVLWDDYNHHQTMTYDCTLEEFLKDCQDFAQCLDNIVVRDGIEPDEMTPMRMRLVSFRSKQRSQNIEGLRDHLDEVLYTRDFQRETITQSREVVHLHQIPSIAQLYSSNQLAEKPTMVQPSAIFNHTVCLVREDITKLDVSVLVNSTDATFAGMGTLDRKVFNRGGFELREECKKFGVCKEGDVKSTPGFLLPAKHVLHVVPPEQYRKNNKQVLRQIYREILYTAQSLRATSIAIPAIGTGMLNYPRRDCASLAMEEVNRFLETAEPTNMLEKIVFVVYSSNDEFVYKSLLPVYFPPIDQSLNRALPASHPMPTSAPSRPEAVSAPRRTLYSSISDAVRNLGGSRPGKRPVSHKSRTINTYEEHALIGFESHAQDCSTCKTMEQLYLDGNDLCEHGYPLAQTLLWYMNLGPDQLVYTRPVQIRQSIRLEVPEVMFPLSLTLLRLVEASSRDEGREHPFISQNRAYSTGTVKQSQEAVQSDHNLLEKIESNTEQELATSSAQKSTKDRDAQTLSPLQVKMQRLSAAASKFDTEPYEQQSATIGQLGDETILAGHEQPPLQIQAYGGFSNDTLTAVEVLYHLNEDLKSRPGSYIGQNTTAIASALSRPLSEIEAATESLSKQNYIHSTIDASTWVISQAPAELRVLSEHQQELPIHQIVAPSIVSGTNKSEKSDLLFQMELLEQQIMSYFTTFRSTPLLERGCKSQDLARALSKDVNEVELALDQLAEQGRVHLASDG
ncbi:hypothetical protein EJ07DRAFT_58890, partial [Lizonia empirigonia]